MDEEEHDKEKLITKINELEGRLIDSYNLKPIVYVGYVQHNIIKFGFTNDIKTRLKTHRSQICNNFKFEYMVETVYNREVEKDIKRHFADKIISKKFGDKVQTELILLDDEIDIKRVYDTILQYKNSYDDKNIIIRLTNEIEELIQQRNDKEDAIKEISTNIDEKYQCLNKIKGCEFACSVCGYRSERKNNVARHIKTRDKCKSASIEEVPTEIKCHFCNKTYSTKEILKEHLKFYCKNRN